MRAKVSSRLIIPTHIHIAIMSKNTLIAGLTLLAVVLATASSAVAELAPQINRLTIKNIERSNNPERSSSPERSSTPSKRRRVAANNRQSMKYVKLGWDAQQDGENDQALLYYYQAVKADQTNAYAFMAAGNLIGDTEDGIICMKAAVALFRVQGNQEGYNASLAWLKQHGAEE